MLFTCRRNDKKSIWKLKTQIFSLRQIICLSYKCELHCDFSIGINRWLFFFFVHQGRPEFFKVWSETLVFQVNVLVRISLLVRNIFYFYCKKTHYGKGQLISKFLLGVIVSTKKTNVFLRISKKRLNQKLYYTK